MGFYEFLVTNNYRLLLSWIACIVPITTPFPTGLFYYSIFPNTQFLLSFSPTYFSTILWKDNIRRLFLNLREWKCIHHKSWHYNQILGVIWPRVSIVPSLALWDCSKLLFYFMFLQIIRVIIYCIKLVYSLKYFQHAKVVKVVFVRIWVHTSSTMVEIKETMWERK